VSQLTDGLNELEKQLRALRVGGVLVVAEKLPGVVLLLFSLLSLIVHQIERQAVILNELKRKADDGKN